jgi:hypothetical protein
LSFYLGRSKLVRFLANEIIVFFELTKRWAYKNWAQFQKIRHLKNPSQQKTLKVIFIEFDILERKSF